MINIKMKSVSTNIERRMYVNVTEQVYIRVSKKVSDQVWSKVWDKIRQVETQVAGNIQIQVNEIIK